MGRGDKKTKRGKIFRGSRGKTRPKVSYTAAYVPTGEKKEGEKKDA